MASQHPRRGHSLRSGCIILPDRDEERMHLVCRPSVITEKIRNYVADFGIAIKGYDEIYGDLKKVPTCSKVLLDQGNVNYRLLTSIPEEAEVLNCPNPTEFMKAVKNETEQKNLHQSHLKEGVAFTRFMYWLKTKVGKEKITEISAAEPSGRFKK